MTIDITRCVGVERVVAKPENRFLVTIAETGEKLRTVVVRIYRHAARIDTFGNRTHRERDGEGMLSFLEVHAARGRASRARERACASSSSRSASGGIWSSRSIITATSPRRSTKRA